MIVGLLSVNDHFAVHASELLLYVLSRVDISMHKTCTSSANAGYHINYIIYHYMTMGNTRNLWPTCCPNQHEIVAEHIGKSEDGPTTSKKQPLTRHFPDNKTWYRRGSPCKGLQ